MGKKKVELVDINLIQEHPDNKLIYSSNRNHEDVDLLENIKTYGLLEPLMVDKKTNYILSGNRRYDCCKKLGYTQVEVIFVSTNMDIIQLINYNKYRNKTDVERRNEYRTLKNELKKLPMEERKKLYDGRSMREYLYDETNISFTTEKRISVIEEKRPDLYEKVNLGIISTTHAYFKVMEEEKGESEYRKEKLRKFRRVVENLSFEFEKNTLLETIYQIYENKKV